MIRRRGLVCLAAALLLGSPRTGAADDETRGRPEKEDGEVLIQRGVELRKLGRNADALQLFERAYTLSPTPRGRAQVALALQALGDWVGAELGLEEALHAEGDPWIRQYRDALEGALATVRAHLAWLWVDANTPKGELVLNGVSVHSIPLERPVRAVVGALDVEVRGAGFVPAHRRIDLAPGAVVRVMFSLDPLPEAMGVPAMAGPGPSALAGADAAGVAVSPPRWRTGGYLALAASAAFAAGGVWAWRVREDEVARYDDDAVCRFGALTRAQRCGDAVKAADLALGLEVGALSASAAAAAAGIWLLTRSPTRSLAAAAWCAPAPAAVACGGSF